MINLKFTGTKLFAVVFVFLLGVFLTTCDKPLEPVGVPKDYAAYFFDGIRSDSNWYSEYHPATNAIDSVFLPFRFPPQVSADGKRLYVRDSFTVAVLETDSFTVIDLLPYDAILAVSPDNKLMFAWKNEGMYLLKTSDYSVIYQDSTITDGRFSRNSKRLYGLSKDRLRVARIELSDSVFESAQYNVPFGSVLDFEPSRDENKIFFYLITSFPDYFAVYDIALDSVIFLEAQQPGYGELEISPDGRYVFYTDPGPSLLDPGGPGWISVYDVSCNSVLTRISTAGVLEPPNQLGAPIDEISVTPDGRWLVALPDVSTIGVIFAADIRKLAVSRYNWNGSWLIGLTTQNGL